jgi:predicted metal-dependent phosphotriesterase family hydrolase
MAKPGEETGWSRRKLIGALGAGVGLGIASRWEPAGAAATGAPAQAGGPSTPRGAIIRTIAADIDPGAITGATLVHEHLGNGRKPPARGQAAGAPPGPPDNPTQDVDWMATELKGARQAGVGCIVSASTGGAGTEIPGYLKTLSERTGMHLLNAGAYYNKQQYPADFATKSEDEIADGLVQMATAGRLGAYGEFGVANGEADLDPLEKKVFRSVGRAHLRTGLPIFTHNNYATGPDVPSDIALRQLDQFDAVGVNPAHVAIGHVCCLDDPKAAVAIALAKRGAYVAFDRVTRQQQWVSDEHRIHMIMTFLEAGHIDRLLLSSDYIGRVNSNVGEISVYPGPLHARDGGPGYARPIVLFVPQMRKAGIGDADIRRITQDNPRRFLAFVPRS